MVCGWEDTSEAEKSAKTLAALLAWISIGAISFWEAMATIAFGALEMISFLFKRILFVSGPS